MDIIEASLAQADREEFLHGTAIQANLGATAIISAWRRSGQALLGDDHHAVRYYDETLAALRLQRDRVSALEEAAMNVTIELARDVQQKYGHNKEHEISVQDHLSRLAL